MTTLKNQQSHLATSPVIKLVSGPRFVIMQARENDCLDLVTSCSEGVVNNHVGAESHAQTLNVRAAINDGPQLLVVDISTDDGQVSQLVHGRDSMRSPLHIKK